MDAVTADRMLLVSEVDLGDEGILTLRPAAFVRVGERYWVEGSSLVIEGPDGRRRVHPGSRGWVCRRIVEEDGPE